MSEADFITSELREAYDRHGKGQASDHDLLLMATSEAERAMRSTPPHCLPNPSGLPHNEDHANACAHRCWTFLTQLEERRVKTISKRICTEVDAREDAYARGRKAGLDDADQVIADELNRAGRVMNADNAVSGTAMIARIRSLKLSPSLSHEHSTPQPKRSE
jgi:hypothetical protein